MPKHHCDNRTIDRTAWVALAIELLFAAVSKSAAAAAWLYFSQLEALYSKYNHKLHSGPSHCQR